MKIRKFALFCFLQVACLSLVTAEASDYLVERPLYAGNGLRGADIFLVNTDSLDAKFHLVEVRRIDNLDSFAIPKRTKY